MRKILILFLFSALIGCVNNSPQNTDAIDSTTDSVTYNLTLHLTVETFSQDSEYTEYEIREAILACQSRPGPLMDTGLQEPSSPSSWCGVKALNIPVQTENKSVDLFFLLEPSPLASSVEFSDDIFAYDTPMLFLDINGITSSVNTVNIENDKWSASASY